MRKKIVVRERKKENCQPQSAAQERERAAEEAVCSAAESQETALAALGTAGEAAPASALPSAAPCEVAVSAASAGTAAAGVAAATTAPVADEDNTDARPKMFGVEVAYLFFLGMLTSMVGWIAENLARLVTQGILDSRYHLLPFIPVYGMVVFAVHLVFGDPDDLCFFGKKLFKESTKKTKILSNLTCLLMMYAAVFFGELIVGNAWELISGVQLWDYSSMPLSVTQYAGLIPTIGYGTGAFLLFRFVLRPLIELMQRKANYKLVVLFNCIFGCLMFADDIAMFLQVAILGEAPVYWQIVLW